MQTPAAARAAAGIPGIEVRAPMSRVRQARTWLEALHGGSGQLTELRFKRGSGMAQEWYLDRVSAAGRAVELGEHTDVYAGVVPRRLRQGGRNALVDYCFWLWAECDTAGAVERALLVRPQAHMVVRSSPGRAHFYWALSEALRLDHLEVALKRLAWELGADMKATDRSRILRVPGTTNHKHGAPCEITQMNPHRNIVARDLVSKLPDPAPPKALPVKKPRRDAEVENLAATPARAYVERLSGKSIARGMCQCPLHKNGQERTASLHVGGPKDELWYCFGCGEGGDIFTFAAKLWGLDERRDFVEVKRRVMEAM